MGLDFMAPLQRILEQRVLSLAPPGGEFSGPASEICAKSAICRDAVKTTRSGGSIDGSLIF